MDINFLSSYIVFSIFFIFICRKYNFIIDYKLERHKRFSSKIKSSSIGGILLGIFFIYQFIYQSIDYYLLIFLLSILFLGLMSDIKLFNNVGLRFFFQLIIILFFTYILNYEIETTKIYFFDQLLQNNIFNIIFVTFCLMVLMNGSNFIDGLNGLLIKYFLIIYLLIFYKFGDFVNIDIDLLMNLIIILTFILIVNLLGLIYMGDSGAYLLSLFSGIYLINFSAENSYISPYLIIVFLWYPCFELLFSMLRRYITKFKAYKPDVLHLHQYIYVFTKREFKVVNDQLSHFLTSLMINFYNLLSFIIAINFIYNSKILISIILINIFVYLAIYNLFHKKYGNVKN